MGVDMPKTGRVGRAAPRTPNEWFKAPTDSEKPPIKETLKNDLNHKWTRMHTKGNSPSRLEFVWIRVHSWLNQRFLKKSIGGFSESMGALASPRSGARGAVRPTVSGYFTGRCLRKHRERLEALPTSAAGFSL